jgi:hypothetical protein
LKPIDTTLCSAGPYGAGRTLGTFAKTTKGNQTMNMIEKIALQITERGEALGWKPGTKNADNANFECWAGAATALELAGHPDAEHVRRVVALIVAVRGYTETRVIAEKAKALPRTADADPFDCELANREGWTISYATGSATGDEYRLERLDDMSVFENDTDAWRYVCQKATEGNDYHKAALEWLREWSPWEWRLVMRNADTLEHPVT